MPAEVPFAASRPGDVPGSGPATVAGVELPDGIACDGDEGPIFWRTAEPVGDVRHETSALVDAFPQTGLWPLLYAFEDPPEHYWFGGPELPERLAVDVGEVMRSQWASWKEARWGPPPILPEFPGPAEPQGAGAGGEPFGLVAAERPRASWEPRRWLLLVPCRRPADVLAAVGWDFSQMPHAIMAALLRSWEERFAAVPVQIDPSQIVLHVGRPPQARAQAERLVAEFAAVCELEIHDEPDWFDRTAALLLPDGPGRPLDHDLSPTHWRISFQEAPPDALFALVDGT
jgi:hypothetical protein